MPIGAPDYVEYIRSREWAARRVVALRRSVQRDGFLIGPACEMCGTFGERFKNRPDDSRFRMEGSNGLEVHHLHYRNLGYEEPEDLIVLCTDALYYREYDLRYSSWRDKTRKLVGETEEEWSAKREAAGPSPQIPRGVGCHERCHSDPSFRREVYRVARERGAQ